MTFCGWVYRHIKGDKALRRVVIPMEPYCVWPPDANPSAFYETVVPVMAETEPDYAEALRAQYESVRDTVLYFLGDRFRAEYKVDETLRIDDLREEELLVDNVVGCDEEGRNVVGFRVVVSGGLISASEAFLLEDDCWPEAPLMLKKKAWGSQSVDNGSLGDATGAELPVMRQKRRFLSA